MTTQTTSEVKQGSIQIIEPQILHDRCLIELLDYRKRNQDFTFWLRERDNYKRLTRGYWFQGTRKYASVGLFSSNSGNRSTKGIGLFFWPLDESYLESYERIGVSFEVLHKKDYGSGYSEFVQRIKDHLKKEYQEIFVEASPQKFLIVFPEENPFDAATKFLDKNLRLFYSWIIELGLEKFLITPEIFERKLDKVLNQRDQILSGVVFVAETESSNSEDPTNDSEEDIEGEKLRRKVAQFVYSKYRHIPASQIRPVLDAKELGKEIALFLDNIHGETPILFGIFGQWGRGKTFLVNRIWEHLSSMDRYHRIDFHAWKHQETPASWGYLYEAIAEKYYEDHKWLISKKWAALRLNFNRESKSELVWFGIYTLIGIIIYLSTNWFSEYTNTTLTLLGIPAIITGYSKLSKVLKNKSTKARELYKKYTEKRSYGELLGVQAEIQGELKTLLKTWIKLKKNKSGDEVAKKRAFLFVDDIDRCSEDRIIQVVDSLRVMLEDQEISKRIVVVAAIDERILRRAIRLKYSNLISKEEKGFSNKLNGLTKEYLDKLFLSGIKLGDLSQDERQEYFGALIEGKVEISESTPNQTEPDPETDNETHGESESLEETSTVSGGGLRGILTRYVPLIDRGGINENDAKDVKEKGSDRTFEISITEEGLIKKALGELDQSTPRQIRIFYLRYLLARDLLKAIKSVMVTDVEKDALIGALTFLTNEDLVDTNLDELINDFSSTDTNKRWNKLDALSQKSFKEILEMVIPY